MLHSLAGINAHSLHNHCLLLLGLLLGVMWQKMHGISKSSYMSTRSSNTGGSGRKITWEDEERERAGNTLMDLSEADETDESAHNQIELYPSDESIAQASSSRHSPVQSQLQLQSQIQPKQTPAVATTTTSTTTTTTTSSSTEVAAFSADQSLTAAARKETSSSSSTTTTRRPRAGRTSFRRAPTTAPNRPSIRSPTR